MYRVPTCEIGFEATGSQRGGVGEVFSSPRTARLVHRFGLTPGLAFDLRTGWDVNDPAQRAHLQHERPILFVGAGEDTVPERHT